MDMQLPASELEYDNLSYVNRLKCIKWLYIKIMIALKKYYDNRNYNTPYQVFINPDFGNITRRYIMCIYTFGNELLFRIWRRLFPFKQNLDKLVIDENKNFRNDISYPLFKIYIRDVEPPKHDGTSYIRGMILADIMRFVTLGNVDELRFDIPNYDIKYIFDKNFSLSFNPPGIDHGWISISSRDSKRNMYYAASILHVYADEISKYIDEILKNKG